MIKILLKKGASIDIRNRLGYTPLHIAVQMQNKEVVEYLLDKKEHQSADPNIYSKDGRRPLDIACEKGLLSIVELLGKKTESVKKETFDTILHGIFILQNMEYVEILQMLHTFKVDQLYDPNVQDSEGNTPLHLALSHKLEQPYVLFFCSYELNLKIKNEKKQTPLHVAVLVENQETVELLINKGADLNINGNAGQTPLHVAIRTKNQDAIKLLIEKGADLKIKDNYNQSALDLATSMNDQAAILLIKNKIESSKPNGTKSDSERQPPVVTEL